MENFFFKVPTIQTGFTYYYVKAKNHTAFNKKMEKLLSLKGDEWTKFLHRHMEEIDFAIDSIEENFQEYSEVTIEDVAKECDL